MSLVKAILAALGAAAMIWGGVRFWRSIPTLRCPHCLSLDVDEDKTRGTAYLCKECGHGWTAV